MKAIGFGDPMEVQGSDHNFRLMIGLKGLPMDLSKVHRLPTDIANRLHTKRFEIDQEVIALEGAPSVAAAVRDMLTHHSVVDVRNGLDTALSIVRNVLSQPKDIRMYRIKKGNPAFNRSLGRLHGSALLMNSIGYFSKAMDENAVTLNTTTGFDGSDTQGGAAYVLKALNETNGKKGTAGTGTLTGTNPSETFSDTSNFKFPSLNQETERFLWRRKADIEISLRALENQGTLVDSDFFLNCFLLIKHAYIL